MTTNVKLLAIKSAIFQMGLRFNQEPSDAKITAYAKDLMNYTPEQVTHAFRQVILSGSAFFPSLAEILKHLRPKEVSSEDIGNAIASEIIQKCIDHGIWQLERIYAELSDSAKMAIGSNTYILREIAGSDQDKLPTLRAQIRGMVKGSVESHKANKINEKLEKIGIKNDNVFSITSGKMMALDFSQFETKDLA